jgi:hypothetical protein
MATIFYRNYYLNVDFKAQDLNYLIFPFNNFLDFFLLNSSNNLDLQYRKRQKRKKQSYSPNFNQL